MSAKLLGSALAAQMASPAQKLVLVKLVDCGWDDGSKIFPSIATLAAAAQCSARSVQRELRRFERAGLLIVVSDGGKGRGSTTEYKLDIAILRRLELEGWKALFGALSDGAEDSPEEAGQNGDDGGDAEAAKGATVSPLSDGFKGDTGDTLRVTPETPKGDTRSHPTPYRPLKDPSEREGAGASAREADPDQVAVEREEASVRATMDALAAAWPNMAVDNLDLATRKVRALAPDERRAAVDLLPAFLDFHDKLKGKRDLPYLHTYLGEKRWKHLPAHSPAAAKAADVADLQARSASMFSRRWWWLFWSRLARDGKDAARRTVSMAQSTGSVLAAPGELPDDATLAAMPRFDPNGEAWKAWRRYAADLGVNYLPQPDKPGMPVWAPSEKPPGGGR